MNTLTGMTNVTGDVAGTAAVTGITIPERTETVAVDMVNTLNGFGRRICELLQ